MRACNQGKNSCSIYSLSHVRTGELTQVDQGSPKRRPLPLSTARMRTRSTSPRVAPITSPGERIFIIGAHSFSWWVRRVKHRRWRVAIKVLSSLLSFSNYAFSFPYHRKIRFREEAVGMHSFSPGLDEFRIYIHRHSKPFIPVDGNFREDLFCPHIFQYPLLNQQRKFSWGPRVPAAG